MKIYIFLLVFIAFLLTSCAKDPEEIAVEINSKICSSLTGNLTSSKFEKAEQLLLSELTLIDMKLRKEVEAIVTTKIVDCIRFLNYTKTLPAHQISSEIECNAKGITLEKKDYNLELKSGENSSFSIMLSFHSDNQIRKNDETIEAECRVHLSDKFGKEIASYPFYPTPDLKKLLASDEIQANIRVNLMPLLADNSNNPIRNAKEAFMILESIANLSVSIKIKTSAQSPKNETNTEVFEDLLDKIEKKKDKN